MNKFPISLKTTDILLVGRSQNQFEIYVTQDGLLQRQSLIALRDRCNEMLEATAPSKAKEQSGPVVETARVTGETSEKPAAKVVKAAPAAKKAKAKAKK